MPLNTLGVKDRIMLKKIKKFLNYIKWLEEQRMKAAIKSGSAGPLM